MRPSGAPTRMPSHPILLALERQRKVSTSPSSASRAPSRRVTAPAAPRFSISVDLGLGGIAIASAAFLVAVVAVAFIYYG